MHRMPHNQAQLYSYLRQKSTKHNGHNSDLSMDNVIFEYTIRISSLPIGNSLVAIK